MEIQEVFEDMKKTLGDKGFLILIGGFAILFVVSLLKGSEGSNDSEVSNVVVTASYPDAVTNADVIISTLQNSIDYSEGEIKEEIQGLGTELNEYLEQNFEATNDFINTGFESQEILMSQNFDDLQGGLDGLQNSVDRIGSNVSSIKSSVSGISSNVSGLQSVVNNMKNQLNNKTTTTKTSTTKSKATNKNNVSYYTYKTKSGYNTNTSIVDALKVIGVDSSMGNRKKIAQANGIKNYTGSYSQNVTLLSKLKQGKLIKI